MILNSPACNYNDITSWSKSWSLPFNEMKSIVIQFCSSSTPNLIHSSRTKRNALNVPNKDRGLIFQSDLKWVSHYNQISAKAYKKLGLLKRTFSSSNSVDTKKKLYISVVKSQLLYGSVLWRPMLIKDILSLEKIQRRATKFILGQGLSPLTYKERLVKLNLLPLMYHLELADIMFYINSYKNRTPRYNISDYITPTAGYTRSSDYHRLSHKYSRTNTSRHFYYNRLPRLWNNLPPL